MTVALHKVRPLAGLALALAVPAGAVSAQTVSQTNLVANSATYHAEVTNSIFINPWGMAVIPASGSSAAGPFWISSNGWGNTPIYSVTGTSGSPTELAAPTVPLAKGETGQEFSAPTGQVVNPTFSSKTPGFMITDGKNSGPAIFLVDTEDGTICGWNPNVSGGNFTKVIDNYGGGKGAVYKGLATFTDSTGTYLLATNFRSGLVEVYDTSFTLVGEFRDHAQPAGHAPFNVQTLGGKIYVTYAQQDAAKHDDAPGAGNGIVDIVDIYGTVQARTDAAHVSALNSAWGLALAPASWGSWAGQLMVGNFGNGWINVFNAKTLAYMATVNAKSTGKPLAISGLWGLRAGEGGKNGSTAGLYFTAGPNKEADGLFGVLTLNAAAGGGGW